MSDPLEIIGSLLSWMGQCTPRAYVDWLRKTQPDLFSEWAADDMERKLQAVIGDAWSALSNSPERNKP